MIKIKDECCEIIKNIQIADGMFDLTVKSDFIAGTAMCGQFANILVDGKTLRRPISICDAENGVVRFVYQVKGEGTQWLSQRKAGESLVVFGPLGKGFNFKSKPRHIVLIGGGIGTPPMLKTLKTAVENGCIVDVILGFRNKSLVILEDEFKAVANSVTVCTDDGSYGVKGFVTDALKDVLKSQQIDCVMTCGPTPMLKAIAGVCMDNKVSCQVSLEERMGCGVGACVCCVCKVKLQGFKGYQQVCKSGPVFDAKAIVWYDTKVSDKAQFEQAKQIRTEVFCDEQGFPYGCEFDELDDTATHLITYDGARPIATGRVIDLGNGEFKLGRIAVLKAYRGREVGKALVEEMIEYAMAQGAKKVLVDSQVQAKGFYAKVGFKEYGEEHMDCHVPHVYMSMDV
ncbi:MAG: GNAT family N-acetyltransferase [Clostridia bacterium]|nr:GNAT family N-acetyltransferase [Clostridia bacterium]